jgi:DNA-binding MarR family transcriptional regulator
MSTPGEARSEKILRLEREVRLMSSFDALFSQAVGERVGMHSTDIETMDLLNTLGPMTAGELSQRTGLSSGATTRLIDRLERAGFVRRRHDEVDRRRIIIDVVPENCEALAQCFVPMAEGMLELWESFTDDELDVITEFVRRSNAIVSKLNARMRAGDLSADCR